MMQMAEQLGGKTYADTVIHYSDVIMRAIVSKITGRRWIPRTKASNAENLSIWWRQHGASVCHICLRTAVEPSVSINEIHPYANQMSSVISQSNNWGLVASKTNSCCWKQWKSQIKNVSITNFNIMMLIKVVYLKRMILCRPRLLLASVRSHWCLPCRHSNRETLVIKSRIGTLCTT